MSTISGPIGFDFIRQGERKFYLFSDFHFSSNGMCAGKKFQNTLQEFSDVGELFYYYLEVDPRSIDRDEPRRREEPIEDAIKHLTDCRSYGMDCLPNIIYNWVDVRSFSGKFAFDFLDNHLQEFLDRVKRKDGPFEFFLSKFLNGYMSGLYREDQASSFFVNSVSELCENFPEKFETAMRVLESSFGEQEARVYERLSKNWERVRETTVWTIITDLAEVLLVDLNFISRIEHINKDGSIPQNVIYYAGATHVDNFTNYLKECGIDEHLSYGERYVPNKLSNNYNRCFKLDKRLSEF